MQRIRSALRLWLSVSAFAAALTFSAGLRAGFTENAAIENAAVDDSVSTVNQYYAILCNTCSTTGDYINKAVTQYPRARDSTAYVYNLASGQIRSIALNWDPERGLQAGGYEVPTDSRLRTYVTTAGDIYRRNNNSLSFNIIIRGDGSVYLKPASGSIIELRYGSVRGTPSAVGPVTTAMVPTVDGAVPGRGSPIDLRGYSFSPYFSNLYPNFPATSYDLAFGDQPGSIDAFVHDYFSTLGNGPVAQIFDPESMSGVGGAHKLTEQVTGQVSLFVPMKDGGYARVRYDTASGDVTLKQVVDPSGVVLPNGYGNALQFYGNRTWNLGANAAWTASAFQDWAARNGIDIVMGGSGYGRITCVSRSINEVTCTIYPN
jgi:hypothetical protein